MTAALPAGLVDARDQACDALRRVDGKATTLLSLVGASLAGVIALTNRAMPAPAAVALWAAAVPIAVSVLQLLTVIRPRLNPNPTPGHWLDAAQSGPRSFLENLAAVDEVVAAQEVCVVARIAARKYRQVRRALEFLVVGLAVLAVGLVLAVVL